MGSGWKNKVFGYGVEGLRLGGGMPVVELDHDKNPKPYSMMSLLWCQHCHSVS
jgi:hypothetical protein